MKTRLWIGAGVAGVLIVVVVAASQESKRTETQAHAPSKFEVAIPTAQEVRAMLGAYGARVEENEKALTDLKTELATTRTALVDALKALQQDRERDLGAIGELFREKAETSTVAGRFRLFEFPKTEMPAKALHIPAGSFGEATLLSGVYAPTTGEPLPVLIRLDAALIGPRRTRVPIRGAFLVGRAAGDANSQRAVVQLDTLSIVREDGKTIEVKVNGWAIGDDGVQGVPGTYVWRTAEIAALASLAGGMSAGADAFAAREATTSVTPLGGAISAVTGDPVKFAGYRALGEAAKKIGEVVSARLNEITPAIHVANGKRISVAFISGATLEGMEVDDAKGSADPYRGLDGRK